MSNWKNIGKLSEREQKAREAAFEAQMLGQVAPVLPKPPVVSSPPVAEIPPALVDAVQIVVTENGQTNFYTDLASVPASIRQRILEVWRPSPPLTPPPIQPERRPRSQRTAQTLNLMLPGAGHLYLGKHVTGGLYASGFMATFVAMIVIFARAYSNYLRLSTGGDIFGAQNLEQLAAAFPLKSLVTLLVAGVVIYLVSAIHLTRSRPA